MKPSAPPSFSPRRQFGAASVAIAMLIVFILGAAVLAGMKISGSSVVDAAKNEEQVSALFLAESGLERARGILSTDPTNKCNTNPMAFPNTPFNVGRGKFTYAPPTYTQTSCPGTASTSCCSVEVTGNIGSSSRTLRLDVAIGGGNGSVAGSGGANPTNACTTSPIATSLINPVNAPAVLLSVLGYRQHIPGGPPLSSRDCTTTPAQTVTLNSQNFESNSVALVGVRGNIYDVAALGTTKLLQGLDQTSNYSLVSVVFPGVSDRPPVKGTYWNDLKQRPNNTGTEQVGSITGSTNSGVANNTDTCDTPVSLGIDGTFAPNYHGSAQSCHSWCYGGDTLVFSLAHGGTSATSEVPLGGITFNTGGTPAQNIKMKRKAHKGVPNVTNQCGAFGCFLYSDIWYAYNSDYLYGEVTTGSITTNVLNLSFTADTQGNAVLKNCTAPASYVGWKITGKDIPSETTITNIAGSNCQISNPATGSNNGVSMAIIGAPIMASTTVNNTTLNVTGVTSGALPLSVGDVITGANVPAGTSISAFGTGTGGTGTYTLSANATLTAANVNMTGSSNKITADITLISPTTMTVTGVTSGALPLSVGDTVAGAGIPVGTKISAFGTGTGGTGTYTLSANVTATTTGVTVYSTRTVLTVSNVARGALNVGNIINAVTTTSPTESPAAGPPTAPYFPYPFVLPAETKISAFGTGTGGTGTYTLSSNAIANATGVNMAIAGVTFIADTTLGSPTLNVTAIKRGAVNVGNTLYSSGGGTNVIPGTTIVALGSGTGGKGTYYLSTGQTVASKTIIAGGTSSTSGGITTVSVPGGQLPVVGTIVSILSGSGQFTSKTIVQSVDNVNRTFTVSATPTIALNGAQICGGVCAFFDGPSSTTSTTSFTVDTGNATENANTHWAGGFTCLSGVDSDPNKIKEPLGGSPTAVNWRELVK